MTSPPKTPKVAAIVLVAGQSSRFGSNKLVAAVEGEPMVRHVARLALASSLHPVIAVTGYQADQITEALAGLDIKLVTNPDFAQGISTSLRAGLRSVPVDCDGAIVLLGDMPLVPAAVIDSLLFVFAASGGKSICVAAHSGQRGNPVLWPRQYFPKMMALAGDRGAKPLLQRYEECVVEVPVPTGSIFVDFDEEKDLEPARKAGA